MDISVEPSSVIILIIVIILLYISHIVSELETSITAVSLIRLKTLEDALCNDEKEKSKYLKIKYLIDIKDKQEEIQHCCSRYWLCRSLARCPLVSTQ